MIPLPASAFQPGWTRPALTRTSMSPTWESMAMSASNPEAIDRACAPEPLYDSSNRTSRPVVRFHSSWKAGRMPSWNASFTTE